MHYEQPTEFQASSRAHQAGLHGFRKAANDLNPLISDTDSLETIAACGDLVLELGFDICAAAERGEHVLAANLYLVMKGIAAAMRFEADWIRQYGRGGDCHPTAA